MRINFNWAHGNYELLSRGLVLPTWRITAMTLCTTRPDIFAEQVRLLYANAIPANLTLIFTVFVASMVLRHSIAPQFLLGWMMLMTGLSLYRLGLGYQFNNRSEARTETGWAKQYVWSTSLVALGWSLFCILLFPREDIGHQSFIIVLIIAIMATAVPVLSAVLPAVLVMVIPIAITLAVQLILQGSETTTLMGILVFIYSLMVIHTARIANANIKRTLTNYNGQKELVASLSQQLDEGKSIRFDLLEHQKHLEKSAEGLNRKLNEAALQLSGEIKARTAAEEKLRRSQDNLSITLNSIGDAVILTNTAGKITYMNPVAEQLTGWGLADVCKKSLNDVFHVIETGSNKRLLNPLENILSRQSKAGGAATLVSRRGESVQITSAAAPIVDKKKNVVGIVLVFHDVSEQLEILAALRENEALLAHHIQNTPLAAIVCDKEYRILQWNASAQRIFGYDKQEAIGRPVHKLIVAPENSDDIEQVFSRLAKQTNGAQCTHENITKDGRSILSEWHGTPLYDDKRKFNGLALLAQDITERKRAEAEIERLAFYDPLTDLPNRRMLLDRLRHELAVAQRYGTYGALLFLDLDHFKTLNDALGHAMGDLLLQRVAKRLTNELRGEDTVARLGGDEFVILLPGLGGEAESAAKQAQVVAEKLRIVINTPYSLQDHEHHTSTSIGVTLFPEEESVAERVLKHADTAMYRAKESGRNAIRFYLPGMQAAADARLKLEQDLRRALEQDELEIYFQPLCAADGKYVSCEALLRWNHAEEGLMSPASFLAVAEETGLILPIGEWVLHKVCDHLQAWQRAGLTDTVGYVGVNISSRQLRQPDFVSRVESCLKQAQIDPSSFVFEFREGTVINNAENFMQKIQVLRNLGIHFSIDDFGTGYSSLRYLKQLPLEQMKIDKSFVEEIGRDPNSDIVVETIISIAKLLKLSVVAEGVETEHQIQFLRQKGCQLFQGYYFGAPQNASQFLENLKPTSV